jgi:hypothetical protein
MEEVGTAAEPIRPDPSRLIVNAASDVPALGFSDVLL